MSTIAERRAAYRLAQPTLPLVLRTWHGAQVVSGEEVGLRGFLIAPCPCGPGRVQLKPPAQDRLVCVAVSALAGFSTRHGGVPCPGADCTEGDPINLEEAR
jgi:hypothetical protein